MTKQSSGNYLRYLVLAIVVSIGIIGIIASGGGGGGDDDPPPDVLTALVEGICKNKMEGLGEDSVIVDAYRPSTADKTLSSSLTQLVPLPPGEFVASTRTNTDGSYRFDALPANETYFFTYTKDGFLDEAYFEVTVEPDTPKTLEPVPLLETQYDTTSGFITGVVSDAVDNTPLLSARVRVRAGINNTTGTVLLEGLTDSDGTFTLGALDAGTYTLETTHPDYQTVYFEALVLDADDDPINDMIDVGTVALIPDSLAGSVFFLSGSVFAAYDASDGSGPFPLSGAAVRLRDGIDNTVGSITSEVFTTTSGFYQLNSINAGQYTLEGVLTGYNPGYLDITLGADLSNQNVTLMPSLPDESGQITTVLTWGDTADLDGRLFEVDPTVVPVPPLNNDTDGYGPETTLLESVDSNKRYEYFVNYNSGPTRLSESKAQVRVYRGDNRIFTFDLPLSDPDAVSAEEWHVFTISVDTIQPVNDLGYRVRITDASAEESDPGTEFFVPYLVFDVFLDGVSEVPIELDMATEDGTATAGVDYLASGFQYSTDGGQTWLDAAGQNGTRVTIPAGQTAIQVRIETIPDYEVEEDETYTLRIVSTNSAAVVNIIDTGTGTIINDDVLIVVQ